MSKLTSSLKVLALAVLFLTGTLAVYQASCPTDFVTTSEQAEKETCHGEEIAHVIANSPISPGFITAEVLYPPYQILAPQNLHFPFIKPPSHLS